MSNANSDFLIELIDIIAEVILQMRYDANTQRNSPKSNTKIFFNLKLRELYKTTYNKNISIKENITLNLTFYLQLKNDGYIPYFYQ